MEHLSLDPTLDDDVTPFAEHVGQDSVVTYGKRRNFGCFSYGHGGHDLAPALGNRLNLERQVESPGVPVDTSVTDPSSEPQIFAIVIVRRGGVLVHGQKIGRGFPRSGVDQSDHGGDNDHRTNREFLLSIHGGNFKINPCSVGTQLRSEVP